MRRFIRHSLSLAGTAALALASLPIAINPAAAQDPEAPRTEVADLGVMGVNLKDAVKFNWGFQGALQGAGTPNQTGVGAFIPLKVGDNSVAFVDVLVNANFIDYGDYSSIINTTVAGITFSTSTRLGYRWLNSNRSWMFGVNAGYDSRPMATGPADTGVTVSNSQTVFFQQVAAGLEAVSNSWNFNAYALVPVGDTVQQLNDFYNGGALDTYGLDVGYSITPDLRASVGYYYQSGDLGTADGSGINGRLAYNLTNGLTVGTNLSYDQAFETRVSADLKYRFGGNSNKNQSEKKAWTTPVMALTDSVKHREVRVHDEILALIGGFILMLERDIADLQSCATKETLIRILEGNENCFGITRAFLIEEFIDNASVISNNRILIGTYLEKNPQFFYKHPELFNCKTPVSVNGQELTRCIPTNLFQQDVLNQYNLNKTLIDNTIEPYCSKYKTNDSTYNEKKICNLLKVYD